MLNTPNFQEMGTIKAPPMEAVVLHINLAINDKQKKKDFIVDYVLNPKASKAVCESNKVKKYGVMPSLKDKIAAKDLESIADYILEKYPSEKFSNMIKEMQTNDKMNGLIHSPFLMNNEGLPHMTKLLVENWDKALLGLTPEQKEKLLVVRKETKMGINKIKEQLKSLEDDVVDVLIEREDIKTLDKKLEEIAKLKLEATKVHLKCISSTTSILSEEQVAFLLPMWE